MKNSKLAETELLNYSQCKNVVQCLNNFFKEKNELANVEYPSNILYKTNEYYLYMFYSCLLDYGMRSKIYHKNLINTYKMYPNIFDPKSILKMYEKTLKEVIANYIHPRYPNVALKKWINLSQSLSQYDSVLDYLKNINNFEELNLFIKNTKSYGQKTGGLLIRIICDSEICDFSENIKTIPIDRHDIEISYLVGIINNDKISNKNIKELSDAYVKRGKEMDINPSDIDKYLWEIGNSYCNKRKCRECPINKFCSKESEL